MCYSTQSSIMDLPCSQPWPWCTLNISKPCTAPSNYLLCGASSHALSRPTISDPLVPGWWVCHTARQSLSWLWPHLPGGISPAPPAASWSHARGSPECANPGAGGISPLSHRWRAEVCGLDGAQMESAGSSGTWGEKERKEPMTLELNPNQQQLPGFSLTVIKNWWETQT